MCAEMDCINHREGEKKKGDREGLVVMDGGRGVEMSEKV